MTQFIYKIETQSAWTQALAIGRYQGSALDVADGYIHLSGPAQVRETAAKYFAGQKDLVLLSVDPADLGAALRWEAARGGASFPHLYADLPCTAVKHVAPLTTDAQGDFVFGPEIA
jgi:uncharacterized protein (DUF952 family)